MTTTEDKVHKNPFYQTWMTIVYDQHLQFVEIINPQHCMLLQLTPDVLLGTSVSDLEKITEGPNKEPARIIAKNIKKAVQEQRNVYFEYTTTHKDGSATYAICYAERGSDGLLYVNVIKIDEENIFEARDGFTNYVINTTINNISVGVYMRHIHEDGTKRYILFNDVAKEFYGEEDVQQSRYWNPQDEDLADEQAMQLRDPMKIERVFRDDDGNIIRWLVVTKKKITSRAKGFYIITTIIDITKRRQNEILLEQQFALLDSMYEHLPVGIVIYDKNGKLVSLNQKDMDMFGIEDKERVLGTDIFDDPNTSQAVKERLRSGQNAEYEMVYDFDLAADRYIDTLKRGKRILAVKSVVIKNKKGEVDGFLQICEDITGKKATEHQLRQKHKLIDTIYNTIPIGIEVYDDAGKLIEINNHDMQMMGVSSKESVLGVNLFDNPNISSEIKEKTRRGDDLEYTLDYDFDLARDYYAPTVNKKMHLNIKTSTIRDENGAIDSYLLVNQDRTRAVEYARLLEEAVAKFSTIFSSMPTGIEIYDKEGVLIDCNAFDLTIFGIARKEDFINQNVKLSNNPNFSYEDILQLLRGEELTLNVAYDFDLIREYHYYPTTKKGCINLEIKASPMITESGELIGFVVEMNDVTQARLHEEQLETTQANLNLAMSAGNIAAWTYDVPHKMFYTLQGKALAGEGISWAENKKILHPDDRESQERVFEAIISGAQEKGEAIFRYRANDVPGGYRYYESQMIGKRVNDQVVLITGTQKDVTQDIFIKRELELANFKSNLIIKVSGLIVWEYDCETGFFESNDEAPYVEGVNRTVADYEPIIHPDTLDQYHIVRDVLCNRRNRSFSEEVIFVRQDNGERVYVTFAGHPIEFDKNGNVLRFIGYRKDNTPLRSLLNQVQEANQKNEIVLNNLNAGLAYIDNNYRVIWKNATAVENNPLAQRYHVGKICYEIVAGRTSPCERCIISEAKRKHAACTHTGVELEGDIFNITATPVKDEADHTQGYVLRVDNVTESYRQQEELEQSRKDLNLALEAGNVSAWMFDVKKQKFYTLHGNTAVGEGVSWEEKLRLIHPDDRSLRNTAFESLISGKVHTEGVVFRAKQDDGSPAYRYHETRMMGKKEKGQVVLITGTLKDVTDEFLSKQKLEEAHRQSEYSLSLLNNVIEKIPLALFIKDIDDDYKYVIVNERLSLLQGLTKEQIVGHTDYDLLDKTTATLFRNEDLHAIAAEGTPVAVIKSVNMNGTPTIQETTEAAFITVDGRRLLVGVVTDITEKQQEKRELEEYQTKTVLIIQACDIAQWDYDLASKRSFSTHEGTVIPNRPFTLTEHLEFIHPDDRQILCDFYAQMDARVDYSIEARYRIRIPKRSGYSDVIVNGTPLKDAAGEIVSYTGLRRDMTEWNAINRQLVEERTKAEAADRLKSAFLANMSHEIRTPLNAIVGFSELLQTAQEEEDKAAYINIINNNNELLLRLISDILDLSKIESGSVDLKLESFDLSEVFMNTYTALKTRCTNPDVEFRGLNPYKKCIVTLDKDRLLQVGTNFITNAIKYTPSGHILMGYEYVDGGIRLYVEDTGIGISKEKHSLLFQRFSKLDDFAQGTGLGLAISKAIVDVMGGKIGCESEEHKGSTFWVWIPCTAEISYEYKEFSSIASTTPLSVKTDKGRENHSHHHSLLVAEDNDSNYLLVQAMLVNYSLTRAVNGEEAVALAAANRYDAILMDMKMPVMDGLEATRRIRIFDRHTPIIALTANAFDTDKEAALQAGCTGFVTKPLKKAVLEQALEESVKAKDER